MSATGDPVELLQLTLVGERILGVALSGAEIVDARLDDCDLAGVTLTSPMVRRATVHATRLRDCEWSGGIFQDVSFDGCPTERFSLRFSTLQRVAFTGCRLAGADFYGVTFDKATFDGCDLTGAHFDGASVKELSLRSCQLLGVTGALSLKGAVVDLDDLPALAPSLAREAGLRFDVDG